MTTLVANPLPIRPPKKWWDFLYPQIGSKYKKFKGESEVMYDKRITRIVARIWWDYPTKTKQRLSEYYADTSVQPRLLNPETKLLPCPKCGVGNPVTKANLFLRCGGCNGRLISVHVKKKK